MEEKRDHKIYVYTNKVNGKVYVGRTCVPLKKRAGYNGVAYKGCPLFWRAIQKYGWENFKGEIIEEGLNNEEATEKEIYYIRYFEASSPLKGYNILDTTFNNSVYSDENRESRSRKFSGEGNPMYAYEYTEEQKEKMRERNLGINNPFYGKHHSQETIDIIKEKLKVYYETHESPSKGRKLTEEQRKRLSESKKGKYCGKDSHRYGIRHTEESKRKISEHLKGRVPWNRVKVMCVETGEIFNSAQEACNLKGIDNSAILKCCKGRNHTAGGYHWEYVNEPD